MGKKGEKLAIAREKEAESARDRLVRLVSRIPKMDAAPAVAQAIERAYNTVIRHTEAKSEQANDAYTIFGVRLIEVLERIGYFGERGAPFEYDDGNSLMLRNSSMNVGFDNGLTLAMYIFSELQKIERRPKVKQSLQWFSDNLRDISLRQRSNTFGTVKEVLASHLPSYALALWLISKEPKPIPKETRPFA